MASNSLYLILDTTHEDYSTYLGDLSTASAAAGVANFAARESLDSSKALVQVKSAVDTSGITWWDSPSACLVSSGTESWALDQMWADWTAESGNDWNPADE
jgi:hypothetical protein